MEDFDEIVSLGSSNKSKGSRKKKGIKNKNTKETNFFLCLIIIFFVFIFLIVALLYIFNKKISAESEKYEKIILILKKENIHIQGKNEELNKTVLELNQEKKKLKEEINELSLSLSDNLNKSTNKTRKKNKIIAISYGDNSFKCQLNYNKMSALDIAKVDEYFGYGPENVDPEFKKKNQYILSQSRGNGYWLWKPYFLLNTMKKHLKDGDVLIYSDAGTFYTERAQLLVDFLDQRKAEMYLHRLPHLEKSYTKRDAFLLMGADMPFYSETGQFNAAFQVYRKSKFTEMFLEEYLYYAQDKRIITDDANELGKPNYDGFIAHRHDQSVLSLLTKKYSQVNANKMNIDINIVKDYKELMPTIFYHYRYTCYGSYDELKNIALAANKDINKRESFN